MSSLYIVREQYYCGHYYQKFGNHFLLAYSYISNKIKKITNVKVLLYGERIYYNSDMMPIYAFE